MSLPNEAPPDEQELALRLARAGEHLRADRLDEAGAEIDAVLGRWPQDVRARNMLGLLHFRAGRFSEARLLYEDLLVQHGEDPSLRLNLGLVELRLGRYPEAVRHLGWVAELEPDNARAQGYYGLALLRAGELHKARAVLQRAGQDDLVRQLDKGLGGDGSVAAPATLADGEAPPAEARSSRSGRVATPEELSSPAAQRAVSEARRAVAAGARALDEDQPFAPPEPAEMGADRDWQVRGADEDLPPPLSPRSAPRPIPLPQERSQAAAGAASAQPAQPLGRFLRERELGPPEGGASFGVTPGGLLAVRIDGRLPTRSIGVVVSTGELNFEPLQRRARGRALQETFGEGPEGLFRASGRGMMVISPRGGHFAALALTDEAVYVRESAAFSFEESLYWENGRIPGSGPGPTHPGLPDNLARVVQFRGVGQFVVRTERPLFTVRLPGGQTSFIEVEQLIGWTGRIIPSLLLGEDGTPTPYVECSGEGFLLVEPPPREGNPVLAPAPSSET